MKRSELVYLMLNHRNRYVKIGISNNPAYREKTLQSEEPEIVLLATAPGGRALESNLHGLYADRRLRGEWFDLTPDDMQEIVITYDFKIAEYYRPSYLAFISGKDLEQWFKDQLMAMPPKQEDPFELYLTDEYLDEVQFDAL